MLTPHEADTQRVHSMVQNLTPRRGNISAQEMNALHAALEAWARSHPVIGNRYTRYAIARNAPPMPPLFLPHGKVKKPKWKPLPMKRKRNPPSKGKPFVRMHAPPIPLFV